MKIAERSVKNWLLYKSGSIRVFLKPNFCLSYLIMALHLFSSVWPQSSPAGGCGDMTLVRSQEEPKGRESSAEQPASWLRSRQRVYFCSAPVSRPRLWKAADLGAAGLILHPGFTLDSCGWAKAREQEWPSVRRSLNTQTYELNHALFPESFPFSNCENV